MKELDTIRKAIEGLLEAANHNVGGMVPGVIASWCHKALAVLSTIDPEVMRCPSCGCVVDRKGHGHHSAADCIFMHLNAPDPDTTPAHDDAIRRECADSFTKEWHNAFPLLNDLPPEWTISAILGTEPARDIPKCTRPNETECHAHGGDECYNHFQCEPARELA